MIFLGAGASKAFGLKTMQDLTDDLVKKMIEKGHKKTIDEILQALKRFGFTPDFENIYTVIDSLVDPKEGIRKSGAFTAYIASKGSLRRIKGFPEYKEVLQDFRDLIYDECTIKRGMIEKKGSVFDKLFGVTAKGKENRFLSPKMGTGETREVDLGSTIVTTNYDMAVELYHRWKEIEFCDGFKSTRKEYVKELDFFEYGRHPTSKWLIKLHGSIWEFSQGKRIIQTIVPPDSLPLNISIGEQMLIYPVGEKPILQEPYYSFYSIFKNQPWNVLIAIGYSFRDDPVNVTILERLKSPMTPKAKLIVVDPNAVNVIRNMGSIDSQIDRRIIRINEHFEDDETLFEMIKIAIESTSWDDYKQRLVRVRSPLLYVTRLFPPELRELLDIRLEGKYVIIKGKRHLTSNNFSKIASVVRGIGGEYISAGKDSHFRVTT